MTTSSFIIRRAEPADAVPLSALKLAAFRETFLDGFAIPYPPADLALFEADSYGAATVARELADPTHATWVAETADGQLLAYAHVGPCKLPHPEASTEQGELYQLYARNAAQGQGVGRALMDVALDWLAAEMPGPVWLGVWSGNDRALAVYEKRGFVKVGGYGFPVGTWTDREYILRRG
ncbi:GNAT family N-acetyltransferase [Sphingobium sp. CR2-8]|uniref:GNAT family N-acetyltransferase n=1 Tax=Sphingobium sp. CR2-8 TaxID=1306534 RepID=UPI002DBE6DF1|nr:GNAT family N-acetyltransferase [Sphingobium sp. CR2-8]MEC3911767.1 GNAT family N-acetyltransferase [Sphingobium sp. CR2-8]